jgi:hypothetical protein
MHRLERNVFEVVAVQAERVDDAVIVQQQVPQIGH